MSKVKNDDMDKTPTNKKRRLEKTTSVKNVNKGIKRKNTFFTIRRFSRWPFVPFDFLSVDVSLPLAFLTSTFCWWIFSAIWHLITQRNNSVWIFSHFIHYVLSASVFFKALPVISECLLLTIYSISSYVCPTHVKWSLSAFSIHILFSLLRSLFIISVLELYTPISVCVWNTFYFSLVCLSVSTFPFHWHVQ